MMWKVEFNEELVDNLFQSLRSGAIIELAEETGASGDLVELKKVLVDKADGFKFYIYSDEHPPPHFHVQFAAEKNSFSILDATPLHPNGGLKRYFKNIRKWHRSNRDKLVATWNSNRPVDCPVGLMA